MGGISYSGTSEGQKATSPSCGGLLPEGRKVAVQEACTVIPMVTPLVMVTPPAADRKNNGER